MASVVREVYEALREAGVSEKKAIAVAEAFDHAVRSSEGIEQIKGRLEALSEDVIDLKINVAELKAEIRRLDDKIENRFRWVLAVVTINLALTLGMLWQIVRLVGK